MAYFSLSTRGPASFALSLLVLGLVAGCDPNGTEVIDLDAGAVSTDRGPVPGDDAGPGPEDTGETPFDTGVPPFDTGVPPVDTGEMPRDTGETPADTGVLPLDTGVLPQDTGQPPVDTGTLPAGPDPVAFSGALPTGVGRVNGSLSVAGRTRRVVVIRPTTAPVGSPLVLLFHGTNTDVSEVIREAGAEAFARDQGVVVIAPVAEEQTVSDWDHPGSQGLWWVTYPRVDPNTNPDLLFVRALFVAARRDYGTDPGRVYLVGHSNGAFFAQLAAMQLRERVAAWASSSGGLCNCRTRPDCTFTARGDSCEVLRTRPGWCNCVGDDRPGPIATTGRLPPAYLTHGSSDEIVTPYFTCALAARLQSAGYTVSVQIRDGERHVMPDRFLSEVWPFLSAHRIP